MYLNTDIDDALFKNGWFSKFGVNNVEWYVYFLIKLEHEMSAWFKQQQVHLEAKVQIF